VRISEWQAAIIARRGHRRSRAPSRRRQWVLSVFRVKGIHRRDDLHEVVLGLCFLRAFLDLLECRERETHQHRDDQNETSNSIKVKAQCV
jgi:hypothetical protein